MEKAWYGSAGARKNGKYARNTKLNSSPTAARHFAGIRWSAWAPNKYDYFAKTPCTKLNRKSYINSVVLLPSRCLRAFPSCSDPSHSFSVSHTIHTIFMQCNLNRAMFCTWKKIIETKCFHVILVKIGFDGRWASCSCRFKCSEFVEFRNGVKSHASHSIYLHTVLHIIAKDTNQFGLMLIMKSLDIFW